MNRRSFLAGAAFVSIGPAAGIAAMSTIAHIHGKIVSIDRRRGTFMIHHQPFAQMPMAMTMEVEPLQKAQFAALHVGEIVDAVIDTKIVPWPASTVKPSKR